MASSIFLGRFESSNLVLYDSARYDFGLTMANPADRV